MPDLPLSGVCVLVTRAADQAGALTSALRAAGAAVREFAAISVADPPDWRSADAAVQQLPGCRWAAFTSANGVDRFLVRLHSLGGSARSLAHLRITAVGRATAAALQRHGLNVQPLPAVLDAAALAAALAVAWSAAGVAEQGPVLVVRAEQPAFDMGSSLRQRGIPVVEAVAYRTLAGSGDAVALQQSLGKGEIDYVALSSGATFQHLVAALADPRVLQSTRLVCIGPRTAAIVAAAGLSVSALAAEPSVPALVAAVTADVQRRLQKE